MTLKIITPAGVQIECTTGKVFLPGVAGSFEVLNNHAPIVSVLENGSVRYEDAAGEMQSYPLEAGFVKVKDNVITVCCE